MSLPLPPPARNPPLPLPPMPDVRTNDMERTGKLTVTKVGRNRLEVRVGNVVEVLDRAGTFRLIGMLERVGGSL